MNHQEAFTLGANAYYKGESRSPVLDPAIHPFTQPHSNITADNLLSWLTGWDTANLEHQEADQAEHEGAAKAEKLNEQILTHGAWRPDPEADYEDARERWMEDLDYKMSKLKETAQAQEGVTLNSNGSVTLSAKWIMENSE